MSKTPWGQVASDGMRRSGTATAPHNHRSAVSFGRLSISRFGAVILLAMTVVGAAVWLGGEYFHLRAVEALSSRGITKVEISENRTRRSDFRVELPSPRSINVP